MDIFLEIETQFDSSQVKQMMSPNLTDWPEFASWIPHCQQWNYDICVMTVEHVLME